MRIAEVKESSFSEALKNPLRDHFADVYSAARTKELEHMGDKIIQKASTEMQEGLSEMMYQLEKGKNISIPKEMKKRELEMFEKSFETARIFLENELGIKDNRCWLIDFPLGEDHKYTRFTQSHDASYKFGEAFLLWGEVRKGKQEIVCRGLRVIGKENPIDGTVNAFRNKEGADGRIIAHPEFYLANIPSEYAWGSEIVQWAKRGNNEVMEKLDVKNIPEKERFLTRLLLKPEKISADGNIVIFEDIDSCNLGEITDTTLNNVATLEDIVNYCMRIDKKDIDAIISQLALESLFLHKGSATKKPSIHRNIKPSNVYISRNQGCLKLTNYGMLKEVVFTKPEVNLTQIMMNPGAGKTIQDVFSDSLAYMSPEAAYQYLNGNPTEKNGKLIYLQRLDPKDKTDQNKIKTTPKEHLFSIDGYLWTYIGEKAATAALADKNNTGNSVIQAFYDSNGKYGKKKKCYKAFEDSNETVNVVVMDTKSDIFQIGATLYEIISGGRNPLKHARSTFPDNEHYMWELAQAAKEDGQNKISIPSLKDYMLCSSVYKAREDEFNHVFSTFKVEIDEEARSKVESIYVIGGRLMLMCDEKGKFLNEKGARAKKVFSSPGEEYILKKKKMPKTKEKLLLNIHNRDIDGRINDQLCEIVDWCLELESDKRPTAQQFCEVVYCLRNGIRIKNRKIPEIEKEDMLEFFRECVEKGDREIFTSIANKIYQNKSYQDGRR
jgi:serine/threonine protein kinase